jgi:hypothetical protein
MRRVLLLVPPTLAASAALYRLLLRGSLALDLGIGRRTRPLGPISIDAAAPPQTLFDVIAEPYLQKTPRAMAGKLRVLERGSDLALAAHFTQLGGGKVATTVETVRFERPTRVSFRLVRGPVPHVIETFELRPAGDGTRLAYQGELGTDLWGLGQWWGNRVATIWEQTVRRSLDEARSESERRAKAERYE